MENTILARVIERIELLPSDLQYLVLEFVQTLQSSTAQGVPGRELLQFAGAIPAEGLSQMHQAVAVACEQVPMNEW
ncbi:MAG: hypothetical protein DCC55_14390 [Chloroflexi bacterium]|nr:MAG: hypothetical protein DCC55_14390 [Chloroflexota bacterium]